jgi:hypothetical protein
MLFGFRELPPGSICGEKWRGNLMKRRTKNHKDTDNFVTVYFGLVKHLKI